MKQLGVKPARSYFARNALDRRQPQEKGERFSCMATIPIKRRMVLEISVQPLAGGWLLKQIAAGSGVFIDHKEAARLPHRARPG